MSEYRLPINFGRTADLGPYDLSLTTLFRRLEYLSFPIMKDPEVISDPRYLKSASCEPRRACQMEEQESHRIYSAAQLEEAMKRWTVSKGCPGSDEDERGCVAKSSDMS